MEGLEQPTEPPAEAEQQGRPWFLPVELINLLSRSGTRKRRDRPSSLRFAARLRVLLGYGGPAGGPITRAMFGRGV